MTRLAGVDIGGTKCAVSLGETNGDAIMVLGKHRFPTPRAPQNTLEAVTTALDALLAEHPGKALAGIGISCGGPLDSQAGLILSPPNLPGWDQVDVLTPLHKRYGVSVGLQNDANACALAEWKWGAGRGCSSLVFLTFGTGMGAGLILNNHLYTGTNDMAGEVGHIRLDPTGPTGYRKAGSFEGFCSGGGIAQLARQRAEVSILTGSPPIFCPSLSDLPTVTTENVALAAQQGDALAISIFETVARQLGRGLAILVDILNPERIIIGSIYTRQQSLLEPLMLETLREEALPRSLDVCKIVPSFLSESLGDLASLSVALNCIQKGNSYVFHNRENS
jgi:glucokinase